MQRLNSLNGAPTWWSGISPAALAALPVYSRNAFPLILPVSTACELGYYNPRGDIELLKYQKDNAALMTYCIDDCIINHQGGTVYAVVQNNDYANRIMEYIPMLADVKIDRDIPSRVEKKDTYLIVGYSEFACAKIRLLS